MKALRDHLNSKKPAGSWRGSLWVGLAISLLCAGYLSPGLAGAGTTDFQVEMVAPQRFRIESRISGPVSASLVGGGGNQTLITRQENGHAVIDAEVPVGAVLHLKVGSKSLELKMVDSQHYQCRED